MESEREGEGKEVIEGMEGKGNGAKESGREGEA